MPQITLIHNFPITARCDIEATRNDNGDWVLLRSFGRIGPAGEVITDGSLIYALNEAEAEDSKAGVVRTPC